MVKFYFHPLSLKTFLVVFIFQIPQAGFPRFKGKAERTIFSDKNPAGFNSENNFTVIDKNSSREKLKSKAEQLIGEKKQLCFEENKGQMTDNNGNPAPGILFKAESPGLIFWVTTSGLTYQFIKPDEDKHHKKRYATAKMGNYLAEETKSEWKRVDMILKDAFIKKENIVTEGDVTNGEVNYYFAHCPDGIFNVKTYKGITVKNVYPGIDWVLKTSPEGGIKHDFIVHPNADAGMIKLIYEGNGQMNVADHQINFENELGKVSEGELLCYQDNISKTILSNYTVKENKKIRKGFSYEVGFEIASYNTSHDLVIDPQLVWGTYYGGFDYDGVRGIATDASGNVFIAGYVASSNFLPVLNSGGGAYFQGTNAGGYDLFLIKFNVSGVLMWATYYGGTGDEAGLSLATDAGGNVFMTGYTTSGNFPTFNPGGGAYYLGTNAAAGAYGIFLLKFSNSGSRLWATYFGDGIGTGADLTTDNSGNLFVTGYSEISGMPTVNPGGGTYFQGTNAGGSDVILLKFSNSGSLLWATYYGGTMYDLGYSIVSDASGNVFVTGYTSSADLPTFNPGGSTFFQGAKSGFFDAFLLKFSNNGTRLWATYYGGSNDEFGNDVATDGSGNLFVTGSTSSANFPVQNAGTYFDNSLSGQHDIFILKFSNSGARQWGTLYGGSGLDMGVGDETGYSIATDVSGNVFVTGYTSSSNFPTLNPGGASYFKPANSGGAQDSYILEFDNNGTRLWATYNGTSQIDFGTALATEPGGNLFAAGEWQASGSNGLANPGAAAYYHATFSGGDDSYIMKFGIPVPLPVELISFDAGCREDKSVLLQWQTASEINNDYFSIQRRGEGNNFEIIGTLKGSGNSTGISNYSFIDANPLNGINYYRLQQTDYNGENAFSKIVALHNSCDKIKELFIFPNPAHDFIEIFLKDNPDVSEEIKIYNTLGEIVMNVQNRKRINISHLASGIYLLKLSAPSQIIIRKLVIE